MKRRIFGLETEYGLTCALEGQRRLAPDRVARYLFADAYPDLRNANAFLENGGRLYLDTGFHPEYATPECDSVVDLITHDKAGERLMEDLSREAEKRLRDDGLSGSILLFKNNTDTAGNSYGCHENYLVNRDVGFQHLAHILVPFFVTRQIFCGAGKLLRTPRGAQFCISQRAQHMTQEISGSTTSCRSIMNTRDEAHADVERYRRLHVIVGDSNMSEATTFLKIATTALMLDMIEDGFLQADYALESPVQAIRDVSHDPLLRKTLKLRDGRSMTALELQGEYWERASRYMEGCPDPESNDVIVRWGEVLRQLERDPRELSRDIDWVIKRELLEAYQERHQLAFRDARLSLIDLQYHDIRSAHGLYGRLAGREAVTRITDEMAIEQAKSWPPETTRARLRGEFIRQAKLRGREYRVDWVYLKLHESEQPMVLCKDPFQARDERVERLIQSM